jgi:hypothetical protein
MDEGGYWALVARAWGDVDGGALAVALADGEAPPAAVLEDRYRQLVPALVSRLGALPLEEARSAIERHRSCVRALDGDGVRDVAGAWMYDLDGDALAVVPLLGEAFFRRVVTAPGAAAVLARAAGLGAVGGWRPLAGPVRERWRSSLLSAIPDIFADVPYPGDADVVSGDWPTTEECRYFCGKDWRAIDRSALHRRYADISFVTPRGLQYLLPAFLLAALEDIDGSRVCGASIASQLLFKLSHGYMRSCVRLLAPGQRQVLADALRLEYENWQRGPLSDHDGDLRLALDQLDSSKPSPRRPKKRSRS